MNIGNFFKFIREQIVPANQVNSSAKSQTAQNKVNDISQLLQDTHTQLHLKVQDTLLDASNISVADDYYADRVAEAAAGVITPTQTDETNNLEYRLNRYNDFPPLPPEEERDPFIHKAFIALEKHVFGERFFERKSIEMTDNEIWELVGLGQEFGVRSASMGPDLLIRYPDVFLDITRVQGNFSEADITNLIHRINPEIQLTTEEKAKIVTITAKGPDTGMAFFNELALDPSNHDLLEKFNTIEASIVRNQNFSQLRSEMPSGITQVLVSPHLSLEDKTALKAFVDTIQLDEGALNDKLNLPNLLSIPMLKTFIEMGKVIESKSNSTKTVHSHKIRGFYGTHSFTATPDNKFYATHSFIGNGRFKKASLSYKLNDNTEVVRIKLKATTRAEISVNERNILREIHKNGNAPHVMGLGDIIPTASDQAQLVFNTRYSGDGTFLNGADLSIKLAALTDVAKGVKEMHDAGFVHFDLKTENILVSSGETQGVSQGPVVTAVVSDFDGAREIGKVGDEREIFTKAYSPPEAYTAAPLHAYKAYDVFSLGATIIDIITDDMQGYEILEELSDKFTEITSNRRLSEANRDRELQAAKDKAFYDIRNIHFENSGRTGMSETISQMIVICEKAMEIKPENRPTAEEVVSLLEAVQS